MSGTAQTPVIAVADFDAVVDVVVAGSGGGIAGAYTAAREGLSVLLVEATDQFGGTTAYSGGGGMWFPCNPVLQRAGSDDTLEAALTYFHAVVGDRTPRDLQDTYVLGGAPFIDYLEKDSAFEFMVLPWPDYYGSAPGARNDGYRHTIPVPLPDSALGRYRGLVRGHWTPSDSARPPRSPVGRPRPGGTIPGRARQTPHADCRRNAPLTELIVEDGAVVGAVIEQDGSPVRVQARRGVLLASGASSRTPRCGPSTGSPAVPRTPWARRRTPGWHTRPPWRSALTPI